MSVGGARGVVSADGIYETAPGEGVYDVVEAVEGALYDDAVSIMNPKRLSHVPMSPKFDDVIYMKQGETPSPPLTQKPATPPVAQPHPAVKPPPSQKARCTEEHQ